MNALAFRLTHGAPETGYARWEFELPVGRYAMTLLPAGTVALSPLASGQPLANPLRTSGMVRAWTVLTSDFAPSFEEHLLACGLDPLSTSVTVAAVIDAARDARAR